MPSRSVTGLGGLGALELPFGAIDWSVGGVVVGPRTWVIGARYRQERRRPVMR